MPHNNVAEMFAENDNLINNLFCSFTALQSMDLIFRIESALIWADRNNLIVMSLSKACYDKKPANLIIRTCQEMIADNEPAMSFILGSDLCDRIKNFMP